MNKLIFIFSILILILSLTLVSAYQEPFIYYKLNCYYNNGNISIDSIEIEFLDKEIDLTNGNYFINTLGFNGKLIKSINFSAPNKILYDSIDEQGNIVDGGEEELNETSFEIYVPYYENADELVIYNPVSKELTREDVSEYSKDEIITDKNNSTEKKAAVDEKEENQSYFFNNYWFIAVLLILVLVIIIYFIKRRKK